MEREIFEKFGEHKSCETAVVDGLAYTIRDCGARGIVGIGVLPSAEGLFAWWPSGVDPRSDQLLRAPHILLRVPENGRPTLRLHNPFVVTHSAAQILQQIGSIVEQSIAFAEPSDAGTDEEQRGEHARQQEF